jgi:hypothetical protein
MKGVLRYPGNRHFPRVEKGCPFPGVAETDNLFPPGHPGNQRRSQKPLRIENIIISFCPEFVGKDCQGREKRRRPPFLSGKGENAMDTGVTPDERNKFTVGNPVDSGVGLMMEDLLHHGKGVNDIPQGTGFNDQNPSWLPQ